jgi:hypothetical protein
MAEEIMTDNPDILASASSTAFPIAHIYKLVRDGMRIIRVHITLGG